MTIDYEKYGRIICAALFHNNCIYMSKKGHYELFPMEPLGVLFSAIQGFVTENGFFVDRKVGLSIAEHFHQINKKHRPLNQLMSEDLKKEDLKILKRVKSFTYKEKNT